MRTTDVHTKFAARRHRLIYTRIFVEEELKNALDAMRCLRVSDFSDSLSVAHALHAVLLPLPIPCVHFRLSKDVPDADTHEGSAAHGDLRAYTG